MVSMMVYVLHYFCASVPLHVYTVVPLWLACVHTIVVSIRLLGMGMFVFIMQISGIIHDQLLGLGCL